MVGPGVPRLHVIVPDEVAGGPGFRRAARELRARGGAELALHLRTLRQSGRRIHELAAALAEDARRHGGWCVVNERVDVALTAGAQAVQLGRGALPVREVRSLLADEVAIGASVHADDEAWGAVEDGASFLLLGTIFSTPSHPRRAPAGIELVEACRRAGRPVIAIGGMTPERVPEVAAAGAHGVATLRGVWGAASPPAAVERFLEALEVTG